MSPLLPGETDLLLNMKVIRDWDKGTIRLSQPQAVGKPAMKSNLDGKGEINPPVPMGLTPELEKPAEKDIALSRGFDCPSALLTAHPDVAQSVGVLIRFMACLGHEGGKEGDTVNLRHQGHGHHLHEGWKQFTAPRQ